MKNLHEILNLTGKMDEIYKAMDTYDMLKIVNAAERTLQKNGCLKCMPHIKKSNYYSNAHRKTGNEYYQAGYNRLAIVFYNSALSLAPPNSEEIILALGNRSAVFFSIRYFSACIVDIDLCLALECNKDLAERLQTRRNASILQLREEITSDIFLNINFVPCLNFNCSESAEVPCASEDVSFIQNGVKRITAGKDIKCGRLVVKERAYSTSKLSEETNFLSCHQCNKMALSLIPCKGCCEVMFCSTYCQEVCMKDYHRIECQIMGLWAPVFVEPDIQLVTRAVLKLSLKLGWDSFIAASTNIGASRFKTASVRETFDSREPLSILSYNDEVGDRIVEGRTLNGSLFCALIIHWLGAVGGYFPEEFSKCKSAKEAMARVMLRLYVTFNRKVSIICSSYDFKCQSNKYGAQTNYGWFSMISKLKHSCEPNLMVVGLNDSVGLVALRTIKAGEELTISFIEHFYDMKNCDQTWRFRANHLYRMTRIICDCNLCNEHWDLNSLVNLKTTARDKNMLTSIQRRKYGQDTFRNICEMLDKFPIKTVQYQRAYWAMRTQMGLLQIKHAANKGYIEDDVKLEIKGRPLL